MTEPVWDGAGNDPWLTARLAALAELAVSEVGIREALWLALSSWLVRVSRAVLSSARPDPAAVWSLAPAWEAEVKRIVNGPIKDTIGVAYEPLLGGGYPYDSRPYVVQHLASVTNRMVRTPDMVFDLVAGQLSDGANQGESIPKLAARVDEILSMTKTERWPNRATVVARSEVIGALNAGRHDAFGAVAEVTGEVYEKMWVTCLDRRTRATHRTADGQRVSVASPFVVGGASLMHPGDPTGPAREVIQCLPGTTLVDYRAIRAVMRRWYDGDIVTIRFSCGDDLTITPNHPILRVDGKWISAGLVNKGDHCVRCDLSRNGLGTPDEYSGPSKISEIYRAACEAETPNRVALSPPDLHSDTANGEIEVVPVHGDLSFYGEPMGNEEIDQFGLTLANFACSCGRCTDSGSFSIGVPFGEIDSRSSTLGIRGCCENAARLNIGSSHSDLTGLTSGTGGNPESVEMTDDSRSAGPECLRHRDDAIPIVISSDQFRRVDVDSLSQSYGFGRGSDSGTSRSKNLDDGIWITTEHGCEFDGAGTIFVSAAEVVSVDRHPYVGHVFNLDTGIGWYTANCIPVRNCRCTTILLKPGENVDLTRRPVKD